MHKIQRSLEEARRWVHDNLDFGVTCPCCDQLAKRYHRALNSGMARSLITMYKIHRRKGFEHWIHLATEMRSDRNSREEGKLASAWGLLEELNEQREDGGRAGYWRLTQKGKSFVENRTVVPKYAFFYNAEFTGFDRTAGTVNIKDCLRDKFNYSELMQGI